jgi:hypothetical protein
MKRKLHIIPFAFLALAVAALRGGAAFGQEPAPPAAADPAPVVEPAPAVEPVDVADPVPEAEPASKAEPARGAEPAPAAEPAPEEISPDDDGDGGVAIGQSKKIKIGGRVHAGYEMRREAPLLTDPESGDILETTKRDTKNKFLVKRARIKLSWRPEDWLLAVVQVDVAEALVVGGSILRDAYVHLSPLDQLQIRIGQFKKPFSGLELQSPAKLRVIERGPGIKYIVEDLLYGERDLGLQLSGRLVKAVKLDYSIGVFNGSGPNIEEMDNSKDLVARVQIQPIKQLELGLNGSFKFFSDPKADSDGRQLQPSRAFAGGGDVRVQVKRFRFYAEGIVAQDHEAYGINSAADADNVPLSFVALAMVSYRFKFKTDAKFALEPLFKAELFDPDKKIIADHLWVFTPGVNAYIGDYFHLMLDGEFVRSNRHSQDAFRDAEAIQVLACFDI